ncbi:MAG TPA: hypothetical protein VIU61_07970 [Kofleriaceae bacterium]
MSEAVRRVVGVALLALLVIHVATRPERGWLLLATCDLAAIATIIGLVTGWHRPLAAGFLFQLMVGLPTLAIGIFTTYDVNFTGIAIHVVPLTVGGILVAREGMPRGTALAAWLGHACAMLAAYLFAPPALDINLTGRVWPPLAGTLTLPMFHLAQLAIVAVLLGLGQLGVRKLAA